MADLIDQYFAKHLGVPEEEAIRLHKEYYRNYGLAIEGLVRHHKIDPLEYNAKVDDALPLEGIIKPNPQLRQLLEDIDTTKVRLWLLTNAYVSHGKRVVKLLGISDLFEGLTYCDYSSVPIICKPHKDMFAKAMREAGVERNEDCYFVGTFSNPNACAYRVSLLTIPDDNYSNCVGAKEIGWTAAHLVEEGLTVPRTPASQYQIRHLEELRDVYPQFFRSAS